jgi:cytochrome c peroxidase
VVRRRGSKRRRSSGAKTRAPGAAVLQRPAIRASAGIELLVVIVVAGAPIAARRFSVTRNRRLICGLFKTPTLRNVATRHAFFHNGVIHSLEQAIRFYNTRDTRPELWYSTVGGRMQKFDDLPASYRKNLDKQLPLDGRAAGSAPPMTEQQVRDLICFLYTLTDDYRPGVTPVAGGCTD